MPKQEKQEQVKTQQTNIVAANATTIPTVSNLGVKPGDYVSLNLEKSYGFIAGRIILNGKDYSVKLPDNMDIQEFNSVVTSLNNGTLIKGNIYTGTTRKDPVVLKAYLEVLNKRNANEMREAIIGLTKTGHRISGWAPKEILEQMHSTEKAGKNRRDVMDYIQEAIRHCPEVGLSNMPFDPAKHMKSTTVYKPEYKKK